MPLQAEDCEHQAIIHAAAGSETSHQASDSVFQDMSSIPPLEKSNELIDDESWGDTDSMIDDGSCDEMEEEDLGYQVYYSNFFINWWLY